MTRPPSWLVGCGWLTPRSLVDGRFRRRSTGASRPAGPSSRPPRSRRKATFCPGLASAPRAGMRVNVPNTVVGALVESGHFPDPYFGMNLRTIPGTTYPIGERFTLLPTPADSPFKPSWWYRTELDAPRVERGEEHLASPRRDQLPSERMGQRNARRRNRRGRGSLPAIRLRRDLARPSRWSQRGRRRSHRAGAA